MEFSYQNYVNRFTYKPFEWPPDISLAELHSRCSQPGPVNPHGVKCPCCGYSTKTKVKGWFNRDIYEDFKDWGSGIPAYFGLMRFYNIIAFTVFLINAIYPIYVTYIVCKYYNSKDICVEIGFLRYLAFGQMAQALKEHDKQNVVNILMILQTVVFYILLLANNASIFYLVWINRKCKKKVESTEKYLTLLVENLPHETTQESLLESMKLKSIDVKSITFIKEIHRFSILYRQRILLYFKLKALHIDGEDPKKQKALNEQLRKLEKEYLTLRELKRIKNEKAVVVFKNRDQMLQIMAKYKLGQYYQWKYGLMAFFSKKTLGQIFTSKVPDIQQIIWTNMGENHTHKMMSKIRTFIACIILIALCYALFYYPLKFSLQSHANIDHSAHLTLAEKFLPGFIAILMLLMSIGFRMYMEVLAQRRFPKTYLDQSKFVLATTVMFHLVFYLVVPTIFFAIPNGINQSIKLYALSQQAQTFILVQLVLSWVDFVFRMWRVKKIRALSDQREAFKYPQEYLHQRVEYREFPLELKLIVMFKIWSFALFYAFFLPYITFLISLSLIILYLLEKRNLYAHYSQRRYLGVELEIKFLNIYINFFCVYECIIYCLNVDSEWQIIAAVVSTILSLLLQIIYWQVIQKKIERNKLKLLKKAHIAKKQLEEPMLDNLDKTTTAQSKDEDEKMEIEELDAAAKTYAEAYRQFLYGFYHPQLDAEIKNYLAQIDQMQGVSKEEESERLNGSKRESTIEMYSKPV